MRKKFIKLLHIGFLSNCSIAPYAMEREEFPLDREMISACEGIYTKTFNNPNNSIVSIEIKNNKINFQYKFIDEEKLKSITDEGRGYTFLPRVAGRSINIQEKNIDLFQCRNIEGSQSIRVSGANIPFFRALFRTPKFEVECQSISMTAFLHDMDSWTVSVDEQLKLDSKAIIHSITFHKSPNSTLPFSFFNQLSLDLNAEKLNSSEIQMIGANKVTFKFNPEAFK